MPSASTSSSATPTRPSQSLTAARLADGALQNPGRKASLPLRRELPAQDPPAAAVFFNMPPASSRTSWETRASYFR